MTQLKRYTIIGAIFVIILGTLSHFFYDLSNQNFIVGFFSPINESTWEHMKLVFFPMLLFSFAANLFLKKDYPGAASSALCGALLSTALIPVIFYTYSGVLGYNSLLPDILTFVFSVLTGVLTFFCLCKSGAAETFFPALFTSAAVLAVLFFIFTFFPPEICLFQEACA